MRMAIETFTLILIITVTCIMFSSMISISLQNSEARDYYNIVRNRIEDSNYNSKVMEECLKEAEKKGYQLSIQDVTVEQKKPSRLISLKYKIVIPIYRLLQNGETKEALIEGYAR